MTRQEKEAAIIAHYMKLKKCSCFWRFESHNHDRYKLKGCANPCREARECLAAINAC